MTVSHEVFCGDAPAVKGRWCVVFEPFELYIVGGQRLIPGRKTDSLPVRVGLSSPLSPVLSTIFMAGISGGSEISVRWL